MAEIGLIASVIQVAGAGLKLSQTLYQYADGVATADRRIKDIAKEIQLTSFVVEELGAIFKQDETSTLMSENAVKTAEETMKECSSVFAEIDATLKKSKKNTLGRLMLPFRDNKIELLRNHIDKLKSTLQLLMQVLTHAHQIAAKKLDREAEAKQKAQIQELIELKKSSAKKYEESLKNFSVSDGSTVVDDDEDVSDDEGERQLPPGGMAVTAAAIGSSIDPRTLETCVQHVRSLLEDIENLQQALSDQTDDHSEHHQILTGSYLRARGHLDKVLFSGSRDASTVAGAVRISDVRFHADTAEFNIDAKTAVAAQFSSHHHDLNDGLPARRYNQNMPGDLQGRGGYKDELPGADQGRYGNSGRDGYNNGAMTDSPVATPMTEDRPSTPLQRPHSPRLYQDSPAPSRRATLAPIPGLRPGIQVARGRSENPAKQARDEEMEKLRLELEALRAQLPHGDIIPTGTQQPMRLSPQATDSSSSSPPMTPGQNSLGRPPSYTYGPHGKLEGLPPLPPHLSGKRPAYGSQSQLPPSDQKALEDLLAPHHRASSVTPQSSSGGPPRGSMNARFKNLVGSKRKSSAANPSPSPSSTNERPSGMSKDGAETPELSEATKNVSDKHDEQEMPEDVAEAAVDVGEEEWDVISVGVEDASRVVDEKRKRNAGASARFRARRREKEEEYEARIAALEQQLHDATTVKGAQLAQEKLEWGVKHSQGQNAVSDEISRLGFSQQKDLVVNAQPEPVIRTPQMILADRRKRQEREQKIMAERRKKQEQEKLMMKSKERRPRKEKHCLPQSQSTEEVSAKEGADEVDALLKEWTTVS